MEVKCEVSSSGIIKPKEKADIIEMYRALFASMYGGNIQDTFIKVVKRAVPDIENKLPNPYNLSENYQRILEALDMVKDNDNLELLKVYSEGHIIGVGRLRRLSDTIASVPDLTFMSSEIQKQVINQVLEFIENYFTELGYERMELEIPFKDIIYLTRANNLGFHEDFADMKVTEENRTYLLNKSLERNIVNEKSSHHR